jgi:hypothetical protein
MNRKDEIYLALQGLINGIDYDTGEVVEFSDIAIVPNCLYGIDYGA